MPPPPITLYMSKSNGLAPETVIEKTWEGIPGYILCFPVGITMSSKQATEREVTIGMTSQEKAERLLDFRMKTIADVLTEAPYRYNIDALNDSLRHKEELEIEGVVIQMPADTEEEREARAATRNRMRGTIRLTEEEVAKHREPFPDWPQGGELDAVAYEYFNQEDGRGRKTFQLLIEDVMSSYWLWATPRPTISVSAFMQDK